MLRKIETNGIRLNLLCEGEGPPILLLHGFPDDHTVWRKQVPALRDAGFRVIAPDLRGCGGSDAPQQVAAYRIEALVADIEGLLDALRIDRVRLVGHDWGAVLGWHFCFAHPDRVDRYAALSVGHPTAYAQGPLEQKLKGWYILWFQLRGVAEWSLRRNDWAMFRRLTESTEAARWTERLSEPGRLTAAINYYRANIGLFLPRPHAKIATPIMGVFGTRDKFLTKAQMVNSQKHVAGPFRYEQLDDVGHWLQLEAPERVNVLLLDFLKFETGNTP